VPRTWRRCAPVVLVLAAAAACGDSPPTAPAPPALALACPARVDERTADGAGATVRFDVTAQGGRTPAAVVCTPASGAIFPIGETRVSCTVSDAASQNASCAFTVAVARIPTISRTRFLAFGDSITEGVTSPAPTILRRLDFPDAYPGQLQAMLAERYAAQTIEVLNRGIGGERLDEGRERLPGVLAADRPDVLLLLEGVNNIRNVPTRELAGDLDEMVRDARRRNIDVLLATLLPVSDAREAGRPGTQRAIRDLNEEIAGIANKNGIGAPVDLHTLFLQNPSLLGMDGLHPTPVGYTRMAEVFFAAIQERFEVRTDAPGPAAVTAGTAPGSWSPPPPSAPAAARRRLAGR
jgi:lysophospholipase L1-like esterase